MHPMHLYRAKRRNSFGSIAPLVVGSFAPAVTETAFDPASLDPIIWHDPSDLTTLFQDSSATTPVTADNDPLGDMVSKSDPAFGVLQSGAGLRPTFQTAGGAFWIEADGSDDFLASTTFSASQPFTVVSAWRIIAYPGTFSFLWGSGNNQEYGLTVTPTKLQMTANNFTNFIELDVPAEGADFVVTQIYNGASSTLEIAGGASISGNVGASALLGVDIFARAELSLSNARQYGLIAVAGVASAGDIESLVEFLQSKLP